MIDLSSNFLNIQLKNPFIGQIEFTNINNNVSLDNWGAIIVSALKQEEIDSNIDVWQNYIDASDISKIFTYDNEFSKYLFSLYKLKNKYNNPIIAYLDITTSFKNFSSLKLFEKINIDAIALKLFHFPDDKDFLSSDYEKIFVETASKITYEIKIPIFIFIPIQFTNMFYIIDQLFYRGIQGFCPIMSDIYFSIDIDTFEYNGSIYSFSNIETEYIAQWIALFSSTFKRADWIGRCIHNTHPEKAIKIMLAGAQSIICPFQLNNQAKIFEIFNDYLINWMLKHGFTKIEHFLGQMSYMQSSKPSQYLRSDIII